MAHMSPRLRRSSRFVTRAAAAVSLMPCLVLALAQVSCGTDKKSDKAAATGPGGTEGSLPTATPTATATVVAQEVPPAPSPGEDFVGQLTYENPIREKLNAACASCHGTPAAGGAPSSIDLTTYDDVGAVKGVYSQRDRIKARIEDGTMPPVASMLDATSRQQILDWIDAGAPKNSTPAVLPAAVDFVMPGDAGASADASYNVQVAFTNAPTDAQWSLFYTTVVGATSGGTAIGASRPVSETQVTWNTSALPAGAYSLYVELTAGGTVVKKAAAGSVSVSHPVAGNQSPTLTVTSPNGAQTWVAGTSASITYTASDPNGDALTYKIELSQNSGSTWTTLAQNHTGTSYSWAVPVNQTQGVAYRVRVTANDGRGGIAVDSSNSDFGIASQNYTFSNSVQAILLAKCSDCHTTGGNKNQYNVTVYTGGGKGAYDLRARMWARVQDDSMPNSPQTPVSASDKQKLLLWLWAGGPQ